MISRVPVTTPLRSSTLPLTELVPPTEPVMTIWVALIVPLRLPPLILFSPAPVKLAPSVMPPLVQVKTAPLEAAKVPEELLLTPPTCKVPVCTSVRPVLL